MVRSPLLVFRAYSTLPLLIITSCGRNLIVVNQKSPNPPHQEKNTKDPTPSSENLRNSPSRPPFPQIKLKYCGLEGRRELSTLPKWLDS